MAEKVLNIADKETLDLVTSNVGNTDDTDGSLNSGTLMAKSNKILETTENVTDKMGTLLTLMGSGMAEYTKAGTYTLEIPAGITKLTITACGGGGAGCGAFVHYLGKYDFGSGGSGGESIVEQEYTIPSSTTVTQLTIKVGAAGKAKTSIGSSGNSLVGTDGGATIIGDLVTLAGGKAGTYIGSTNDTYVRTSSTTASVGTGSGTGGASKGILDPPRNTNIYGEAGGDGSTGKGGGASSNINSYSQSSMYIAGGGGGGSLGDGGQAAWADGGKITKSATAGVRGGGGAAGSGVAYHDEDSAASNDLTGTNGGAGYVKIVWGL